MLTQYMQNDCVDYMLSSKPDEVRKDADIVTGDASPVCEQSSAVQGACGAACLRAWHQRVARARLCTVIGTLGQRIKTLQVPHWYSTSRRTLSPFHTKLVVAMSSQQIVHLDMIKAPDLPCTQHLR